MTLSELYQRSGTHRLPADPVEIASALGVKVMNYKTVAEYFETDIRELYWLYPLGFSFKYDDTVCIALNENACGGNRRQRFTIAHELAHCVMGHLDSDSISPCDERAAEQFAAELLAPLAVLCECGVRSAEKIARMCGISRQAAEIRLKRLAEREMRGFRASEDEKRVIELFSGFIASYR
ncbi:MAG: ImmA/IrrE family metallo-endopeptidase [Oscillospiraceae bacterium]|nr:ImmA/IrrE family metallo-endopeptidase [Oscillospiraceae bacterium]